MQLTFRIGGEDHIVDRDERIDKILITVADQITAQNAEEDAKRLEADPAYVVRPPYTAGQYAESITMPAVFDPLLKQLDDQRKAEVAAAFDRVDEKTKIWVVAINKEVTNRAVAGDTAFIQKIVDAFQIPIDAAAAIGKSKRR